MADWLINVFCFIATFLFMEFVAWFAHKFIMHGLLWTLHRDHHKRDDGQILERNDTFFVLFAAPAIVLIISSTSEGVFDYRFWIGAGITAYGLVYFLIHDVLIHQRFKWFKQVKHPYLKAIRKAHAVHHKKREKYGGECFGMLVVPRKYYRQGKHNH
jgi:beta-carotene 3-hydroxylase